MVVRKGELHGPYLRGGGLGHHQNCFFVISRPFELIKLRLDQRKLLIFFYIAVKLAMKGSVHDGL